VLTCSCVTSDGLIVGVTSVLIVTVVIQFIAEAVIIFGVTNNQVR
jgi:hypothetical protein